MDELVEMVIKYILTSKHLVAFTGAGVSAESGVPTFRGSNGLWKRFKPEELATPEAFRMDPLRVWEWYKWRMKIISHAKPNPAHYALAKLEKLGILKCIITQNVDGLHQKAGSQNVIELHGSIWRVKCTRCNYKGKVEKPPEKIPPKCPKCNSLLRPDVVWFGEPLPQREWSKAVSEALKCDVMLVIGTSGVVMPAALIPRIAWENRAKIIEINPEDTPISHIAYIKVSEAAGKFFSNLINLIDKHVTSKQN